MQASPTLVAAGGTDEMFRRPERFSISRPARRWSALAAANRALKVRPVSGWLSACRLPLCCRAGFSVLVVAAQSPALFLAGGGGGLDVPVGSPEEARATSLWGGEMLFGRIYNFVFLLLSSCLGEHQSCSTCNIDRMCFSQLQSLAVISWRFHESSKLPATIGAIIKPSFLQFAPFLTLKALPLYGVLRSPPSPNTISFQQHTPFTRNHQEQSCDSRWNKDPAVSGVLSLAEAPLHCLCLYLQIGFHLS